MDDIYAVTNKAANTVDFVNTELLNHMRPLPANCTATKLVPHTQLLVANQMIEQLQKEILALKTTLGEKDVQLKNQIWENLGMEEKLKQNVQPSSYWKLKVLMDGEHLYSLNFRTKEEMQARKDDIQAKYQFVLKGNGVYQLTFWETEESQGQVKFEDENE